MGKLKSAVVLLSVCVILIPAYSCLKGPFTSSDFMIKVDSIHVADTVSSNAPFSVDFFGTIGFDGCFSFKTFKKNIQDSVISVEAWGSYEKMDGQCPSELVTLQDRKLSLSLPIPGNYRLIVKEPDYSELVKRIKVTGVIPY
jgi:hypothetical protein